MKSVQSSSPRFTFSDHFSVEQSDLSFNVFLTEKDKEGRRLWHTPKIDISGNPQVYPSIEEALSDAPSRFQEEIKK